MLVLHSMTATAELSEISDTDDTVVWRVHSHANDLTVSTQTGSNDRFLHADASPNANATADTHWQQQPSPDVGAVTISSYRKLVRYRASPLSMGSAVLEFD